MDALVALTPTRPLRQRRHVGWAAAATGVGCGVATVGAGAPAPAFVVASALGALAVTDWADHRLPGNVVRAMAVAFAASAVGTGLAQSTWGAIGRAAVAAFVAALALVSLWIALPGAIAFGDVKVLIVAAAAAALCSWGALVVVLIAAPISVAATLPFNHSHRPGNGDAVVPFVPGLALAFVIGVVLA